MLVCVMNTQKIKNMHKFRLKAILFQEALVDKDLWATKQLTELGSPIDEYTSFAPLVFRIATLALGLHQPWRAFLSEEPSVDEVREVVDFDLSRLFPWSPTEDLLSKFSSAVGPALSEIKEALSVKAFHVVRAVVQLCLKGTHATFTPADADRLVSRLPPSPINATIKAFVQAIAAPSPRFFLLRRPSTCHDVLLHF